MSLIEILHMPLIISINSLISMIYANIQNQYSIFIINIQNPHRDFVSPYPHIVHTKLYQNPKRNETKETI